MARVSPGTATSITVGSIALQDGDDSTLKVDVLDLTSNNALVVGVVDGSGNQITSFGGGTQYTEGDTDTTITGTAMLMEGASSTLLPIQGTVADGLLVNLGTNNDVTVTSGAITETNSGSILTSVQLIDNAISGAGFNITQLGGAAVPIGAGLEATALRVTLPTNGTGVVGLNAGVNNIGDVDVLTIAAGDNNIGNVDIVSGTITTVSTVSALGTGTTGPQKAEDVASADGDAGIAAMAVRKATPANTSGLDGDYEMLQISAGRLWTSSTIDAALPAGANNIGDVDVLTIAAGDNNIGNVDIVSGTITTVSTVTNLAQQGGVAISLNTGVRDTGTQRVTIATNDVVPVSQSGTWDEVGINDSGNSITVDNAQLSVVGTGTEAAAMRVTIATDSTGVLSVDDNGGILTVDGTVILGAGTAEIGKLAAGVANIGDVDVLTIAAGDNNIGNVDIVSGTITTVSALGVSTTGPQKAEDVAHVSGDMGIFALGVRQDTPNAAAAASNDYHYLATDMVGGLRTALYETDFAVLGTNHVKKYYTSAGAATDGIIWSSAAGKRWYVTDIFINVSAAATVTLEDDLVAGDSPVWKAELAANSGWSHHFGTPLFSGEDAADLLITTSAGNVYVTVTGYEI